MTALAWVRNWLGFDEPAQVRDEHRIAYSPDLIAHLKHDHAGLLRLYGQLEALATAGTFDGIPAALRLFKTKFELHVLTENVKFYCYLEENLARRPAALRTIREFRRDMNAIARAVVNFARKHQQGGVSNANLGSFLVELREVGALLGRRVQREEQELYTLYAP
jgi:Hemerythrin HHE cation binding domain